MISSLHKCILVHIPKTGGTSITKAFGQIEASRHGVQDHRTVSQLRDTISPAEFESYFKFAFIRNPWARIVSWYKNVIQDPVHRQNFKVDQDCSFPDFLHKHGSIWGLQSQLYWLRDTNGEIPLDFIGRFENLAEHFRVVCERLGLQNVELPHLVKAHDSRPYTALYNDESRRIVAERYAEEIDLFGYQFGPTASHGSAVMPVDPKACWDRTSEKVKIDFLMRSIWTERPQWASQGSLGLGASRYLLAAASQSRAKRAAEIGTGSGYSATLICHGLQLASEVSHASDDYRITSYDISKECLFDRQHKVGDAAREQLSAEMAERITFRNPASAADMVHFHALDELGLLFVDGNHRHPWPTLDLLAALPYLAPGATVVLRGINAPLIRPESGESGAKYLFDDLNVTKDTEADIDVPNIGRFVIPSDKSELESQLLGILHAHEWQADVGDRYLQRLGLKKPTARATKAEARAVP
ncbi:MAG: sulfotransferase family 2 domain-containing protein [Planctomycetaceae bacterium]|nr:sulfotransferase family 2 domain-containing protein [Planctomycetaceae bacterium]